MVPQDDHRRHRGRGGRGRNARRRQQRSLFERLDLQQLPAVLVSASHG
jgi:hypothetical protein